MQAIALAALDAVGLFSTAGFNRNKVSVVIWLRQIKKFID